MPTQVRRGSVQWVGSADWSSLGLVLLSFRTSAKLYVRCQLLLVTIHNFFHNTNPHFKKSISDYWCLLFLCVSHSWKWSNTRETARFERLATQLKRNASTKRSHFSSTNILELYKNIGHLLKLHGCFFPFSEITITLTLMHREINTISFRSFLFCCFCLESLKQTQQTIL